MKTIGLIFIGAIIGIACGILLYNYHPQALPLRYDLIQHISTNHSDGTSMMIDEVFDKATGDIFNRTVTYSEDFTSLTMRSRYNPVTGVESNLESRITESPIKK